jgi:hypothetical protein
MTLGERCERIVALIDETLAIVVPIMAEPRTDAIDDALVAVARGGEDQQIPAAGRG